MFGFGGEGPHQKWEWSGVDCSYGDRMRNAVLERYPRVRHSVQEELVNRAVLMTKVATMVPRSRGW